MNNKPFNLTPEECSERILELSGMEFEPEIAAGFWAKIQEHKCLLSERLGRDVGLRTSCIDFFENIEQAPDEYIVYERHSILSEMGAQTIGREIWDTIADSLPQKQLVQRRIILPLMEERLSVKHGVTPPKVIAFFGPPGTGKTHFVKAIAGILSWRYIEIAPRMLMVDGLEKIGDNLREVLEQARNLDEVVLFIDEFEEIAGKHDAVDRIDKSITNEFLKQINLFKTKQHKSLLVCAANYIRQLDAAMLRPGGFDCIIPVGGLDKEGRTTILKHYLSKLYTGQIDLDCLVDMTSGFTPADIHHLFQQVAHFSFERELVSKEDYPVTTETFRHIKPKVLPSLSESIIKEFEQDSAIYARV